MVEVALRFAFSVKQLYLRLARAVTDDGRVFLDVEQIQRDITLEQHVVDRSLDFEAEEKTFL